MNLLSEQGTTVYLHKNVEQTVLRIPFFLLLEMIGLFRYQHKKLRVNFFIQV